MTSKQREERRQAKYKELWTEDKDRMWMKKYSLDENKLCEIKECFCLFDKNGDGVVSALELGRTLRALGQNPTEHEIIQMVDEVDKDDNGTISFDEFIRVVGKKGLKSEADMIEELEEALRVFDKNDDGFIDGHELKYCLKTLGEKVTEEELDDMMTLADVDRDGKLSYCEFVKKLAGK